MEELLHKLGSERPDEIEEGIRSVQKCRMADMDRVIEALYYLVWSTPGFKRQVALVDLVIEQVGDAIHKALLDLVIGRFSKIRSDRRDKFFYFIERSLGLLSFREMLEISDVDVLEHVCRCINASRPADWDDAVFLDFLAVCKPWLCGIFADIRIDEGKVRPYLSRSMEHANRNAMYRLFG